MEQNEQLSIGGAAKVLGVSIDTLRSWDKSGKIPARKTAGGHRYYLQMDLDAYRQDIFALAQEWVLGSAVEPAGQWYCPTSMEFKSRLSRLENELSKVSEIHDYFPLISAIAGEIGNNSFDHNLGNWPDIRGIFFGYDMGKRKVARADRGRGVLKTLRQVRSKIANDREALQ